MLYKRSLEIDQRLETVLRLIRSGRYSTPKLAELSVIKIIHSAPIRIIDRILLPQLCHLRIGVPSVQGLARR
jgi:hypothetical protein